MNCILRAEARVTSLDQLDESQWAAFQRLCKLLTTAVDQRKKKRNNKCEKPPLPIWFSGDHTTRAAFLDGERGTGKTTVMVTLISAFHNCFKPGEESGENHEEKSLWRIRKDEVKKQIDEFRQNVVWLEPLDVEPLPKNCNLLVAILARIEDTVRWLTGASGPQGGQYEHQSPGLFDTSQGYNRALLKLKNLQQRAAIVWEGNLEERRGHLDADSYALEVIRSERAWLSITNDLKEVLDELAIHVFRGADIKDPLFVLPVEDLDLNPAVCLNLLRLLRGISVPRLFHLVIGDIRGVETVVNLKIFSELMGLEGSLIVSKKKYSPGSSVDYRVAAITADTMRKLLPPAQRVRLEPMSLDEALRFRPLDADGKGYTLAALLARLPMFVRGCVGPIGVDKGKIDFSSLYEPKPADHCLPCTEPNGARSNSAPPKTPPPIPLLSFLLACKQNVFGNTCESVNGCDKGLEIKVKYLIETYCPYSGLDLFRTAPRPLLDLWQALHDLHEHQKDICNLKIADEIRREMLKDSLMTLFAQRCHQELAADPAFSPDQRAQVREAFYKHRPGAWTLETLPIKVQRREVSWDELTLRPSPNVVVDSLEVRVFVHVDWYFRALERIYSNDEKSSVPDVWTRELGKTARAALVLYHDMAVLTGHGIFSELLRQMQKGHWRITTRWIQGAGEQVELDWPRIPCLSFWDYHRFLATWSKAVENVRSMEFESNAENNKLAYLFFVWVSGCTAMINRELPVPWSKDDSGGWGDLAEKVAGLVDLVEKKDPECGHQASVWLLRLVQMLMPESGLPKEAISELCANKTLYKFWEKHKTPIKAKRAKRLASFREKAKDNLKKTILDSPINGQEHINQAFNPYPG